MNTIRFSLPILCCFALTLLSGCVPTKPIIEKQRDTNPEETLLALSEAELAEADKFFDENGSDAIMHYMSYFVGKDTDEDYAINHLAHLAFKGADANATDVFGNHMTPLRWAVYMDKAKIVKWLVSQGADVNERGYTYDPPPLHYAAGNGNIEILEFLIAKGANVHAIDSGNSFRRTPLHVAASHKNVEVAKLLVANGADVNANAGGNFYTPLYFAVRSNNVEVAEFLVSKGAKVDEIKVDVDGQNGTTLLHAAAANQGQSAGRGLGINGVKLLVSLGADVHAKNREGRTPLFEAVTYNNSTDAIDIVKFFASKGADIHAKDHGSATPLHYVQNVGIAEFLVSNGADVNAKMIYDTTPLHIAASRGRIDIVKFLVSNGADVHAKASSYNDPGVKQSPLDRARDSGHAAIVEYLESLE